VVSDGNMLKILKMANDVTTGKDLNSYQGNPALADGPGKTGYAKVDLSPLETFAINKYKTNLLDFEQPKLDRLK